MAVGGYINNRVVGIGNSGHFSATSIVKRGGCRFDRFTCTRDNGRAIFGDGQFRQNNDMGVAPLVLVSCTIDEAVGVGHSSLAAGYSSVDDRFTMTDFDTAVVDDCRYRCRDNGIRQATDSITSVFCYYFKVFWHQMIGVVPGIVAVVDGIGIDEGCVTAAIGDAAGVDAFLKRNICTAVGDGWQGGGMNLGKTVNRGGIAGCWREAFWIQSVSESPDGVIFGTVGITEAEDHSSCSIGIEDGSTVHEDRLNGITTDILNDLCGWTADIGQAGHGGVTIVWYTGNDIWQGNMESICPSGVISCAIPVGVCVCLCTCAMGYLSVDSRSTQR